MNASFSTVFIMSEQFITEETSRAQSARKYISTHVLDISKGTPAVDVPVSIYKLENDNWILVKESKTTLDGRCDLINEREKYETGQYKIRFKVEEYFAQTNTETMYPVIEVIFNVKSTQDHHHIPLLLSPYGFSSYRGT